MARAPASLTVPRLLDRKVIAAAETYASHKADIARLEAECKKLKPALIDAMGTHEICAAGNRMLTRGEVAGVDPTPNTVITKGMVGTTIPGKTGRSGYTTLTVQ